MIIGYGNTYCRDDGVALYILNAIRKRADLNILQPDEDGLDQLGHPIDTIMVHQLIPELAPHLANYQKVLFIDAHHGTIPEEVRIVPVQEEYGFHAVTHHMSPECFSRWRNRTTVLHLQDSLSPLGVRTLTLVWVFQIPVGLMRKGDDRIIDLAEAKSPLKGKDEKVLK